MSNASETLKTRSLHHLPIDGIDFYISTLSARDKLQMTRVALKGRGKEETLDDEVRWSAIVVAFHCTDAAGKRIYGPDDVADEGGWSAFIEDFAEWRSDIADVLMDGIRKKTNLNRTYEDAVKNSEATRTSGSPSA